MGGLTAGMAYYSAIKLSSDQIEGFPNISVRGKNKTLALGPEVTLAIASGGSLRGFVNVNQHWEVYARTTTPGGQFAVIGTFPLGPIKLPGP